MFNPTAIIGQAAAAGEQQQGNGMIVLVGWVAIFGVMMFFMFRNQRKQAKQRQEMIDNLKAGSKVVTAGGILATIKKVKDKSFIVEIADKVEIEVTKNGVSSTVESAQDSK